MYSQSESRFDATQRSIADFQEDWNLSQFWYSDATQELLARELMDVVNKGGKVAVISAPSVYSKMLQVFGETSEDGVWDKVLLMEFDTRFERLAKWFVHYDFNSPLNIPKDLKGKFDRILIDPPFLSEECQTKAAITARFMAKQDTGSVIVCTGERMKDVIKKVYPTTKITTFRPEHGNGLSNEFRCYANYESELGNWKYEE